MSSEELFLSAQAKGKPTKAFPTWEAWGFFFFEPWGQFLERWPHAHLCDWILSSEEGCPWARRESTFTSAAVELHLAVLYFGRIMEKGVMLVHSTDQGCRSQSNLPPCHSSSYALQIEVGLNLGTEVLTYCQINSVLVFIILSVLIH